MLTNTPQPAAERIDPSGSEQAVRTSQDIDWRRALRPGRSCCCPSQPAVIAILPPSPGRPHFTDLLLCGHHYRLSRRTLAATGATVLDPDGTPIAPQDIWVSPSA